MSINRVSVLTAYADTRLAQLFLRDRAAIERRQAKLWRRLAPAIARTPALAEHGPRIDTFPIVEPSAIRAHPENWNSRGLSADQIFTAADAAERGGSGEVTPGVFAGFSTGSTGARGVFLSSAAERARYLGQSLAKLLPDPPLRRRRIGLCLRADNALYRDVANAGPFTFQYFSLAADPEQRARDIKAFAPDIFIAPSHVLAELAGFNTPPTFERLYYGAEPLGALERDWITQALGIRPDPIYQATEGFLGAACKHGVLHLNEDSIAFEFERVGKSNRFRPIVTDLRRTTQPMVRVRLDDLVELLDASCACGSPLRAIHSVEGRVADIWRWDDAMIFPREIDVAVSRAIPPMADWRATASPTEVILACNDKRAPEAQSALASLLAKSNVTLPVTLTPLTPQPGPKRRRVQWSNA